MGCDQCLEGPVPVAAVNTSCAAATAGADVRARRAFLGLFAANLVAQGLSFAAWPLLARIYPPAQMGILGMATSAMLLLTPMTTLRYEIALPLCRSAREVRNLLGLCAVVVAGTSVLLALALLLAPRAWLAPLGPAAGYRLFLPPALLAFGAYTVLVYEATRRGDYPRIAATRVSQALMAPVLQLVFGLCGFGTSGLLWGFVLGQWSGTWRLGRGLVTGRRAPLRHVTWAGIRDMAWRFRRFAQFSSWAGVLAGSVNLGNLLFAMLYGPEIGGFVYLADRVLMQPLRVSGNALLQVFVGEAGTLLKSGRSTLMPLLLSVLWKQTVLSVAWLGLVYLGAAVAMPLVFGHGWGPAARYVEAMISGYLPASIALPASHTLLLLGRQRLAAALDALRVCALGGCLLAARVAGVEALPAVFCFSLVQAAAQCLILAVLVAQVHGHGRRSVAAPGFAVR